MCSSEIRVTGDHTIAIPKVRLVRADASEIILRPVLQPPLGENLGRRVQGKQERHQHEEANASGLERKNNEMEALSGHDIEDTLA